MSPNPVLNIQRRNKDVATYMLYRLAEPQPLATYQLLHNSLWDKSLYSNFVIPCRLSDKDFAKTLMDWIRKYGVMEMLISDNARAQTSECVKDIL